MESNAKSDIAAAYLLLEEEKKSRSKKKKNNKVFQLLNSLFASLTFSDNRL